MDTKQKIQICKVAAQAILSDGQLADSEREFIEELMTKYELSEDQRKDVMNRNLGDSPAQFAEGITGFETKNELMVELTMAVAADGVLSKTEHSIVKEIAKTIDVDESEMEMLIKTALM